MKNKIPIVVAVLLGIVVILQTAYISKLKAEAPIAGAFTRNGLPGIYNPSMVVADGQGSALALDSAGRMKVSTTTSLTVTCN